VVASVVNGIAPHASRAEEGAATPPSRRHNPGAAAPAGRSNTAKGTNPTSAAGSQRERLRSNAIAKSNNSLLGRHRPGRARDGWVGRTPSREKNPRDARPEPGRRFRDGRTLFAAPRPRRRPGWSAGRRGAGHSPRRRRERKTARAQALPSAPQPTGPKEHRNGRVHTRFRKVPVGPGAEGPNAGAGSSGGRQPRTARRGQRALKGNRTSGEAPGSPVGDASRSRGDGSKRSASRAGAVRSTRSAPSQPSGRSRVTRRGTGTTSGHRTPPTGTKGRRRTPAAAARVEVAPHRGASCRPKPTGPARATGAVLTSPAGAAA